MKFLKWLLICAVALVLVIGIGVAALVHLVDWNDYKDTIQNQAKTHTGRDMVIGGDLNPSFFPWAGIEVGDIELANAEGYGDSPFARIGSAKVKVEVLPLLRKVVNIRTVELQGLSVDLQRAADGTTNWDDLVNSTATTTTTTTENTTDTSVEVEGGTAAIAALAVGGIDISDANVSWKDAQSGTDAKLSKFNLKTGAIELAKPFSLTTGFDLASNSMALTAAVDGSANVLIDLEQQIYSLDSLVLNTKAKGEALPDGQLDAVLKSDVMAKLSEQRIDVKNLSLGALGLLLKGGIEIKDLDTNPLAKGKLVSEQFSPREMMAKFGIEAPVTSDPEVLKSASLSVALTASAESASLNDLTIKLDDTTFNGKASVPSLAAAIPPLRFYFTVDAIDVDRYLPPVAEGDAGTASTSENVPAGTQSAATGDEPLALPMDLIRGLDVDGRLNVGSFKISNLTTRNINIPVKAKDGVLAINGLKASLYEGQLDGAFSLNATGNTPAFTTDISLAGIQADPLLADLMQKKAFLSGKGQFAAKLQTSGDTINNLTSALNGSFNTAFNDGSINGVNLGYQIRRAKAALAGKQLAEDEKEVKTDFSELSVSGQFNNGVMSSDDLDMRSPLLRVGGAGQVDLPGEAVDYSLTTLITGTSSGQGGEDLSSLKGVKLEIPIRGTFDELAANFAGVILSGMKANIGNNLKGQAEAKARAAADKLKAQAQEKLKAQEAQAREKLDAEKAKAQQKLEEAAKKGADKLKGKLKGLLK